MLTKFAKPYEKSHEKNLNCFERYDALFEIKNNFQFLVLGTPEGYPALDQLNFIKADSKYVIMTQSSVHWGVSEKPSNQNSASPTGIKQFQPIWKLYIKGHFVVTSRTGPTFDLKSDIFVCFLLCFYKMVLLNDLPQKVQCFKIIVYCNFFIQNALLCLNFIIFA